MVHADLHNDRRLTAKGRATRDRIVTTAAELILTDYTFPKDKIFAYLTLEDSELMIYNRLYEMLRPRGYSGSANQLRRLVRVLRPQVNVALYRRLVALPAEEAQVDWGAFGSIRIGHGTRSLSGFVMVLSYSRALFAHFTLDQTLESFLRGHVEAFQVFTGSARTLA